MELSPLKWHKWCETCCSLWLAIKVIFEGFIILANKCNFRIRKSNREGERKTVIIHGKLQYSVEQEYFKLTPLKETTIAEPLIIFPKNEFISF